MKRVPGPAACIMLLLAVVPTHADTAVDRIRALYERVKSLESAGEQNIQSVTLNLMLPAVGLKTVRIRFITESTQADPRKDPFLFRRTLAKVVMEYNVAAAVMYHTEHLYDEKERHVFSFWQERFENNNPPNELRYYYGGKGVVMITADSDDGRGGRVRLSKKGGFSPDELKKGKELAQRADGFLRHFRRMMELDGLN